MASPKKKGIAGLSTPGSSLPAIPPAERVYYREVHGFDPVTAIIFMPKNKGGYYYEAWAPLTQDPPLHAAGAEIGARVMVDKEGVVHNQIVFRHHEREAAVECTHTVVYSGPAEDALAIAADAYHQPKGPEQLVTLPPWAHFAALKSYVAGIAEIGIGNMLRATASPKNSPNRQGDDMFLDGNLLFFGFNTVMQAQIINALADAAPQVIVGLMANWIAELIESASPRWLHRWGKKMQEGEKKKILFEDVFSYLWQHMPQEWFADNLKNIYATFKNLLQHKIHNLSASEWRNLHPSLLRSLTESRFEFIRITVALSPHAPLTILEQLTHDYDTKVQINAKQVFEVRPDRAAEKQQQGWLIRNGVYFTPEDYRTFEALECAIGGTLQCSNTGYRVPLEESNQQKTGRKGNFKILSGHVVFLQFNGFIPPSAIKELVNFPTLKMLILNLDKDMTIPPELGQLRAIERFDLGRNLTDLPSFLQGLTSLRELGLNGNQITALPLWIESLKSLETLDLTKNKLADLPKDLPSSLQCLCLADNPLMPCPKSPDSFYHAVGSLENLRVLDLSNTGLGGTVSSYLTQCSKMKFLDLSGNWLSQFPEEIGELYALESLNIIDNPNLQTLPNGLLRCCSLQKIDLDRALRKDPVIQQLRARGVRVNSYPEYADDWIFYRWNNSWF